jgi:hypothetical protein
MDDNPYRSPQQTGDVNPQQRPASLRRRLASIPFIGLGGFAAGIFVWAIMNAFVATHATDDSKQMVVRIAQAAGTIAVALIATGLLIRRVP